MNPVSWTQGNEVFIMSKLSYEDKINLYNDRKSGYSLSALSKKYDIAIHGVQYLCCLIDKHGFDILRTTKNRIFTPSTCSKNNYYVSLNFEKNKNKKKKIK